MEIDILGIDLAKHIFQLHGAERSGRAVHRSKVGRAALVEKVCKLRPRIIAMEACSSAHHWARRFISMGIEVRLISPQYVAPFVKTNKNDRNDAEAIAEAASRPTMRFVSVKSVEQEDIQAVHRMRAILVRQRTAVINQIRGLLAERGLIIARSAHAFKRDIHALLSGEGSELTAFCHALLTDMLQHLQELEGRIHRLEVAIQDFVRNSALCRKITAVDGVGPLTATAIVGAIGDAKTVQQRTSSGSMVGPGATSILLGWQSPVAGHQQSPVAGHQQARLQGISKPGCWASASQYDSRLARLVTVRASAG
jgi:transposase